MLGNVFVYRVADMSSQTGTSRGYSDRADWRSVEHLYRQFTTILLKGEIIPTEIAGSLGNSLGRVLAFYEDQEPQFVEDLLELWCEIDEVSGTRDERFLKLYVDDRLDGQADYKFPTDVSRRRRPRPFETAVETCRRLVDVNKVRHALAGIQSGAILGGSVSYGRFYNVMGAAKKFGSNPSDADLLLVLRDYEELREVVRLLSSVEGLDASSLDIFRARVEIFPRIRAEFEHCIFSHKLSLWTASADPMLANVKIPGSYKLSLHVFSLDEFDYMTLRDIAILQPAEGADSFDRAMHDYRDSLPPNSEAKAYDSRSFAEIALGKHALEPTSVDGGFVANVQTCLISGNRYCPGLHQNLILPQFEKRWETEEVRLYLRMLTFRWKILERLRTEKTMRPFEEQSLSLSHVRWFVFSPHITRRADRG